MSVSEQASNSELQFIFMRCMLRAIVKTHPEPAPLVDAWLEEASRALRVLGIAEVSVDPPREHRGAVRAFHDWNGLIHEALAGSES